MTPNLLDQSIENMKDMNQMDMDGLPRDQVNQSVVESLNPTRLANQPGAIYDDGEARAVLDNRSSAGDLLNMSSAQGDNANARQDINNEQRIQEQELIEIEKLNDEGAYQDHFRKTFITDNQGQNQNDDAWIL